MPQKVRRLLRWFARCGNRFVRSYLSAIDPKRLARDPSFGLKVFFWSFAFARAGAPRAFRIAAVKAVSSSRRPGALPSQFRKYCRGKLNPKLNPALDRRACGLDVPSIVQLVAAGEMREAFEMLEIRGLGHKLRALFLRDLLTVLRAESALRGRASLYLWCQPIDVWVRMAAKEICRGCSVEPVAGGASLYGMPPGDFDVALSTVRLSLAAGVSPLRVNQGIWYFCSNVVADQSRLRDLLRSGSVRKLDAEVELMKGFLPVAPTYDGTA